MLCKLIVETLMLDPLSEKPILVLKTDSGDKILPIWIGPSEAQAIALELQEIHAPRPMTHDLICNLIKSLSGKLVRVDICDIRDNTFYAEMVVKKNRSEIRIDARPSDAIAVAIRLNAPIYAEERVLDEASQPTEISAVDGALSRWLDNLKPEDFGKYKM
ncbi:MAG: bifunctional nuclease family protein [Acidobacteria bacterium]|nr:bifunctional nuclease family protein [Acidobacteriota bacterium]